MSAPASLLPELEDVVRHGSAAKRAETLRRITSLFLDGAAGFGDQHVAVFDDVIGCLIAGVEERALAELSRRLAPVPNAPAGVVHTLAHHDHIEVAGPVLKQANIADADLIRIAESKGQQHLLAMCGRRDVSEPLADLIVARGDREVSRSVASNAGAQLSENALSTLVKRAEQDSVLAERVGTRTDIPPRLFREVLIKASEIVQKRLLANAKPETAAEIRKILATVTDEVSARAAPRNCTAALVAVRARHREGRLSEPDVLGFAAAGKYEETIASLAILFAVPVEVVDQLMNGERADPILILTRAAGFGWPTVKAIISSRPGPKASGQALDDAFENFERLTPATAQRVVRFWQVRERTGE